MVLGNLENGVDPDDPHHAGAEDRHDQRQPRFSEPAHHAAHDLHDAAQEIDAADKPFDHNTMQALMQEKKEGVESGMVIEVLQKGYMLKDRILRPALVKVSE